MNGIIYLTKVKKDERKWKTRSKQSLQSSHQTTNTQKKTFEYKLVCCNYLDQRAEERKRKKIEDAQYYDLVNSNIV